MNEKRRRVWQFRGWFWRFAPTGLQEGSVLREQSNHSDRANGNRKRLLGIHP